MISKNKNNIKDLFKNIQLNSNILQFQYHKKLKNLQNQNLDYYQGDLNFQPQYYQKLRIISWNVNGIRPRLTKGDIPDLIKKHDPDIFTVQEHKIDEQSLQKLKLEEKYEFTKKYQQYWVHCNTQKGYSGVSVFSKHKPISVIKGFPDDPGFDDEGRFLTLEYGQFYLCSSYTPNLTKNIDRKFYRYDWNRISSKFLNKLKTHKNVILCGDLNVAYKDFNVLDNYIVRNKSGFTYREVYEFEEFMNAGWNDTYRMFYPTEAGITTKKAIGKQYRFDYFIVNNQFSNNITSSKILSNNNYTSDHFPIQLDFMIDKQIQFTSNYQQFFSTQQIQNNNPSNNQINNTENIQQ